jgi:hypothetical protein
MKLPPAVALVIGIALSLVFLSACHSRARYSRTRDPIPDDISEGHYPAGSLAFSDPAPACTGLTRNDRFGRSNMACPRFAREARAFGPLPRQPPPTAQCPMRVRLGGAKGTANENEIVVDTQTIDSAFDDVPWDECVPPQYLVGMRRAVRVDDGWFLAYSGYGEGELVWTSEDGKERKNLSGARVIGFSRTSTGTVLGLAIGRARMGRGGLLAFDRMGEHGDYAPRLVATLPLEPSPVAFDDGGAIIGFAQGFLFRVDESGRVENLHYIARNIGRVSSIAKTPNGVIYLGLECGVLRLVPNPNLFVQKDGPFHEEWWSARDGASGRWTPCSDS